MDSSLFVVTTPTVDTPGTTLMLQTPKRHYVFGNQSEGSQRAITQMGARLMKAQDFFITGRTEWKNIGGLLGMILTLADVTASSYENSLELQRRKNGTKNMAEIPRPKLNVYGPPNLKHTLSTCRRFIFRKGMPIHATEYSDNLPNKNEHGTILPTWQDEFIKVWALAVLPSNQSDIHLAPVEADMDSRRADFDSSLNVLEDHRAPASESVNEREIRYDRIRTDLLKQMFDSNWSFDTLVERHISEVEMPATMYLRNPETNKIESYSGPMPGGSDPLPDVKVLTRTPWPAATIPSLPPTKPALEAVSYIVRTHPARGKFDVQRAKALGIKPGPAYAQLTAGESVTNDKGETITPDMVIAPDRPGQGVAIVDVPSIEYLENTLQREELASNDVMDGVQAFIWNLGPGVSGHPLLTDFIQRLDQFQHFISSTDESPNRLALDSVAAQTTRLAQIDGERYRVPIHDNITIPQQTFESDGAPKEPLPLPKNAIIAERGMKLRLMPKYELQRDLVPPLMDVDAVEKETAPEIIELAAAAHNNVESDKESLQAWTRLVARPDAEVITLGTGSALPSKYRNVSATIVRVPGIGNYLFDAGENTIGQLQRVFAPNELRDVLQNLRMIWISHLHADHHLGTASIIRAWYAVAHKSTPRNSPVGVSDIPSSESHLAVISHQGMLRWLYEYSSVEDFGYNHILPLEIAPVANGMNSGSGLVLARPPFPTFEAKDYQNTLGFSDIQATRVRHCHGAMAVSITFPPEPSSVTAKPFKVSYSGDCRPSASFAQIGEDSTVLIHEATFDDELIGDARAKKHSTTSEALGIGARMNAKAVVLTHFSQRYQKIPVLETVQDGDEDEPRIPVEDAAEPQTNEEGADDMADVQMSTAESARSTAPALPHHPPPSPQDVSKEQVIKIRNKDMKVAIAFDYMRVRIGDIAKLEKFNHALNKLLVADEEEDTSAESEKNGNGKKNGDSAEGAGKKKKKVRNN